MSWFSIVKETAPGFAICEKCGKQFKRRQGTKSMQRICNECAKDRRTTQKVSTLNFGRRRQMNTKRREDREKRNLEINPFKIKENKK